MLFRSRPQLCENRVQGFLAAAILEGFDVNAVGILGAKVLGKYHFAVNGVIVPHDPSNKANYDYGRACRRRQRYRWNRRPVVAMSDGSRAGGTEGQQAQREKRGRGSLRNRASKAQENHSN